MGGKKKSKGGGGKKANKNNKSPPRGSFGKASKSVSGREEEPVTPTSKKIGNKSVPGLTNLGNTCFFNAVMQSLNQSRYLRLRLEHLVATPSFALELQLPNSEEVLGVSVTENLGVLTTQLWNFLQSMQEGAAGTLNPKPVFSEICNKASRFSSHAQQDSQELLHYFLDALRSEEVFRLKRAVLVSFGVGKNKENLTDKARADVRAYGRRAVLSHTFVDDVFGGTLVSTVTCDVCGSCTTVQESFLDLSLPVSDDKSVSPPGKTSHQYRDKKNKMTSFNDNSQTSNTLEKEDVLLQPKKLSGHQRKKMEREKRKAEKKSRKSRGVASASLHDPSTRTVKPSSAQDTPPAEEENSEEDDKRGTLCSLPPTAAALDSLIPGEVTVECKGYPDNTLADSTSSTNVVDPATGEHAVQLDGANTERTQATPEHASSSSESVDGASTGAVAGSSTSTLSSFEQSLDISQEPPHHGGGGDGGADSSHTSGVNMASSYASSGPQTDVRAAATHVTNEQTAELNGLPETATGDDALNGLPEGLVQPNGSESNSAVHNTDERKEEEEASGHHENSDSDSSDDQDVKPQPDSVEMSLKEFCATERLVGDNQFACIQCTNKVLAEKREKVKMGRIEEQEAEGEACDRGDGSRAMSEIKDSDRTTVEQVNAASGNSEVGGGGEDEDESGDENEDKSGDEDESGAALGADSEGFSHQDSVLSQEDSGQRDELTSVESEETEDLLSNIKFCDATKHLLIQTPPIVLTLHMKRFSHHGRQLKKNGKHISFPLQLNFSPYCMESCKEKSDSSGKLLYSLFAVVEHSGSMFAGHYVAYIKQRPAITATQVEQMCSWTAAKTVPPVSSTGPGQPTPSISPPTPDHSSPVPTNSSPTPDNSSPTPDNSLQNSSSTPDNSSPTPDNSSPTHNNSSPTPDNSSPTPDNSLQNSSSTPDNSSPTPDNSSPTPNNSSPTPDNSSPTPDNSSPTTDNSSPTPDNLHVTPRNSPCTPDNSSPTPDNSPDNSSRTPDNSSPTPDNLHLALSNSSPARDSSLPPIPDDTTTTPETSPPKKENSGRSAGRKGNVSSVVKEFDTTAAAGQWYYASDTHVKMVSEEEVMKSQAYLLFYELLPFRT